ncbi:hypothetical protein F5Y14DRAFT_104164 [Nemania sp. NC0429]|nr:hypothetical protein F5Y14DRAFT_104164 [Nemania sp. NC0429]
MAAQALPSASFADQSEAPTRTSAAYGQACTNCAKAKCKCILVIPHPGSGPGRASRPTCERCARLGRECNPSSSVRKRRAAGSRPAAAGSASSAGVSSGVSAASRAANLEQKLEDLVAILKAQATSTPSQASSQSDVAEPHQQRGNDAGLRVTTTTTTTTTSSATDRRSINVSSSRTVPGGPTVVTPASTASSTPSPLPAPANDALLSASRAEETLTFFRQHHLKYFPFIYLPPDMTAAQLQHDRPYLWLNITAICCRSPIKQAALSNQTRAELANRILVTCERHIDMLLGVLCLLGWTMHLCYKPTMTACMGLAISLVSDLRLDKPSQEDDPRILNCFKSQDFVRIPFSTVRTNEERRATLACYVFCSSGSAFLRCSWMRWTNHMEDSLKILATNPEWEGDQILVLMVRIQRLADSIHQTQTAWASDADTCGTTKPPVNIYVKYYRQSLQTIRDQLPETLKNNRFASSLIMSAEMMISEMPFSHVTCWGYAPEWRLDAHGRQQPQSQSQSRHNNNNNNSNIDIGRAEASFATLQASKAFFEDFLSLGMSELVGVSFPVLLNFFRAAQILYRLRVVDEGAAGSCWDDSVDLLAALDLVATRYNQIPVLYGFLTERDADGNEVHNFYVKCAKTFSATLPMWRAHFAQAEGSRTAAAGTGAGAGGAGAGADAAAAAAGTGMGTEAGVGAGSQVTPAMICAGLNSNLGGGRVNFPGGMNNFMLPELFPMDFPIDEAWCNETFLSWDTSQFGLMQ